MLLLVGSDVTADTRVRKGAATLRAAGYDVRVLFTTKDGGDYPSTIDGIPIEHLDTPTLVVGEQNSQLRRLTGVLRSRGGFALNQDRRRAVHRNKLHDRAVAARIARRKHQVRTRARADHTLGKVLSHALHLMTRVSIRAERARLRARRRLLRYRLARTPAPSAPTSPFQTAGDAPLGRSDVRANWRRRLPDLAAMDLVFGPRIDDLEPDVIHVHDYHLLPTAAEAVVRGRANGRTMHLIYDAHEFVRGLTTLHDDRRRAIAGMERRFVRDADAVVTVSDALADRIAADHGLAVRPTVVLNAPSSTPSDARASLSLRAECGLDQRTPLMVYSGNVTPARGVHTLIEALTLMEASVHLALVVKDRVRYLEGLLERAAELDIAHRVHLVPYVSVEEVPAYLREASVGVHPLLHYPNAEIALPNKIFEYAQARIPVVVSDCQAQAEFVKQWGFGEVFSADEPSELAATVTRVLADRERYRAALTDEALSQLSWEGQEAALLEVYERLGDRPAEA